MTNIPKHLATRHLLCRDIAVAAEEALANLTRLTLCGHHDAAWSIAVALLSPGPWRISSRSHLRYAVWWYLLWLERQLKRERPPLDEHNEDAQTALASFAPKAADSDFFKQIAPSLTEPGPGRTAWSAADLEAILATVKPGETGIPFIHFSRDATAALRQRALHPSESEPHNHAAVADAIEKGWRIAHPKTYVLHAMDAGWSAADLELAEGRQKEAVARLGRLLGEASQRQFGERDRMHLTLERAFEPPFVELLCSRVLAPAFGLTDEGVAAYLHGFSQRTPYTIFDDTPRPWKKVLREFSERIEDAGIGPDELVSALEYGEPTSKILLRRAKRGSVLNTPCSLKELAALEARLGTPLPPSYRDFLLASNGLIVPDLVSLLPAGQVNWLAALDRHNLIEAWNKTSDGEASDEEYAIYGADQDCIFMRPRHLRTALQISTTADGDVLLLVSDVRFGAEWEAWFLGNKNPGAYRYRSFREMMEQRVLVEDA